MIEEALNLEEKIDLLKRIAHRFEEEKLEWALGGSMMHSPAISFALA